MKLPKATGPCPTGTVATTVFVAVPITDMELSLLFATYTRDPSGLTATPRGLGPSGTMATTVFVAVAITDTVLLLMFATYTRDPSGVTATPMGRSPTGTVATNVGTLTPTAFVTQA